MTNKFTEDAVHQMFKDEELIKELLEALKRLENAAERRDNTMGDLCRLIEVKAELAAAAKHARAVIAKAEGRS